MNGADRTLLGFDFGATRIGVAVGTTVTGTARPLDIVDEPVVARRFDRIGALVKDWHPDTLVVGRPLHADGTPHRITAAAERFARQLNGRFNLPVALVDERFSTVEARARVRSHGGRAPVHDDAHAAAVILEQYLGALA